MWETIIATKIKSTSQPIIVKMIKDLFMLHKISAGCAKDWLRRKERKILIFSGTKIRNNCDVGKVQHLKNKILVIQRLSNFRAKYFY